MRVITGSARGKRLLTPEGQDVRPTTDRVKEALFSSIQFELEGSRVVDLFAGCGQLGIEALSRGAAFAAFYDLSKGAVEVIRKNLEHCGFNAERYSVKQGDGPSLVILCDKKFDFCFMDPPYHNGLYEKAFAAMESAMTENGVILCEHPSDVLLPEAIGSFTAAKDYRFGRIYITKFIRG